MTTPETKKFSANACGEFFVSGITIQYYYISIIMEREILFGDA